MLKFIIPTLAVLILVIVSVKFGRPQIQDAVDFRFLTIECSVYDVSGKILYTKNDTGCAFGPGGEVLTMDPKLFDRRDVEIASGNFLTHHMIKYSNDGKSLLFVEAENTDFRGEQVKSDCFSRRDFDFKLQKQWCLKDHIEEMRQLGFEFNPTKTDNWETRYKSLAGMEISHANSIHEIPDNSAAAKHPAFQKGNYLINVYGPSGALLIVDSEMKKILWSTNMNAFVWNQPFDLEGFKIAGQSEGNRLILRLLNHDDQVLPDGKILTYATLFVTKGPGFFENYLPFLKGLSSEQELPDAYRKRTLIIKWDPIVENSIPHILFQSRDTKSLKVPSGGQVAVLKNGNLFIVDSGDEGSKILVTSQNDKILWTFPFPSGDSAGTPRFLHGKPLYDDGFIKSRGLSIE